MIAVEGPAQGTNMGNMHALNTSSSVSGATTWFLSHRISLAHNIQNHGSRGRSESNRCKPNLETDLKSWIKNKTQHSLLAHQRPPGSHRWSSTDNPWPTAWVGPETGPAAHGQTNIWDVAAITRAAYKMYVFSSVHIMSFSSVIVSTDWMTVKEAESESQTNPSICVFLASRVSHLTQTIVLAFLLHTSPLSRCPHISLELVISSCGATVPSHHKLSIHPQRQYDSWPSLYFNNTLKTNICRVISQHEALALIIDHHLSS